MNNGKNDLTEGSIGRKLISFFLPIAAGTLFQQLYNAADAIVVGKFVGTIALAAVGGSAAHITNLLIGFFVALSGGYSQADACKRLAQQHEMVASFSRALVEGLSAAQSDEAFDSELDEAIQSIYEASRT